MTTETEMCETWHEDMSVECERERHDGDPHHKGSFVVVSGSDCREVAVRWTDGEAYGAR